MNPADLDHAFALIDAAAAAQPQGPFLWLTGAGISAESGIPTFRGEEGYWTVGSRNYHPHELATFASFSRIPREVWGWYLYRRGVCHAAAPNAAHRALADLDATLGDATLLVTQNVDGLHLRAGSSPERTYQIHGNIDFMRPVRPQRDGPHIVPLPDAIPVAWARDRALDDAERALLTVDGHPARPHVLWFDETYDEAHFRFDSSLEAAARTPLLFVVGTAGTTNLPLHIGAIAARRGAPAIVVNAEPNPFSEAVERSGVGVFLRGTAGELVPALAERLARAVG